MGKAGIDDLNAALKGIVSRSEEWAETPEGRDHEFRRIVDGLNLPADRLFKRPRELVGA